MNTLPLLLASLLCAQTGPGETLKKAIKAALESKSFTYTFKLKTDIPNSDPFEASGSGVMLRDKKLFMEVKGTGGIDKKMVVTPHGTLIWHAFLEDWVSDVEYGDPGAGHGFQNPRDLLSVIQERTGAAKEAGDGKLSLRFEGKEAIDVLGRLRIDPRRLKAEGTWSQMTVTVGDGKIQSLHSTAHINFADQPNAAQSLDHLEYEVTVTVAAYDRDERPTWKGVDVEAALKRLKKHPTPPKSPKKN